ncbi:hypothetical protein [Clostridium tertium]|uniref:hypothetical protein n=1 Tax=Clostridium tertium TaxID=1559 RepID=UPI0024B3C81B|nr:hypothetical protein [Clostridium tertium]MDI9217142.1 hypothetical protein [Clostridium tertium]
MRSFKSTLSLALLSCSTLFLFGCSEYGADGKPVIYLYPAEEETINVKLDYDGELLLILHTMMDGVLKLTPTEH